MWNYDVLYYQFPLHLVIKKTITHNNFSACASLFLDFLHLKIEYHIADIEWPKKLKVITRWSLNCHTKS